MKPGSTCNQTEVDFGTSHQILSRFYYILHPTQWKWARGSACIIEAGMFGALHLGIIFLCPGLSLGRWPTHSCGFVLLSCISPPTSTTAALLLAPNSGLTQWGATFAFRTSTGRAKERRELSCFLGLNWNQSWVKLTTWTSSSTVPFRLIPHTLPWCLVPRCIVGDLAGFFWLLFLKIYLYTFNHVYKHTSVQGCGHASAGERGGQRHWIPLDL